MAQLKTNRSLPTLSFVEDTLMQGSCFKGKQAQIGLRFQFLDPNPSPESP